MKSVELIPTYSCFRLGLHNCQDCSGHWCAFTAPFHLYQSSIQEMVVYFLLHCPLGYPSHLLDGTLLHKSPDFPLKSNDSSYYLLYLLWKFITTTLSFDYIKIWILIKKESFRIYVLIDLLIFKNYIYFIINLIFVRNRL